MGTVKILELVNLPRELDMGDVLRLCLSANRPGARVDWVPKDTLDRVSKPVGRVLESDFAYGAVVVWEGHTTNPTDIAEAVIAYFVEDIS